MQTVDTIIQSVYGDRATAAEKLGVTQNAVFNWKAFGYFPPRLVAPIVQHARERGVDLDVLEIPIQARVEATG